MTARNADSLSFDSLFGAAYEEAVELNIGDSVDATEPVIQQRQLHELIREVPEAIRREKP